MKADRIRGCIYGQAIGDALGLGTEFMARSEVKKNYPSELKEYSLPVPRRRHAVTFVV